MSSEEHGAAPGSQPAPHNERAPLGSWARVYVTVLAALVVDIALLWWLTERYR